MEELTGEQFMNLADGTFDTSDDGRPHAACPRCDISGSVTSGPTPGALAFTDCGHTCAMPGHGHRHPRSVVR
ncbi:hypothetical protein ACFRQM_33470 [Streptomyces sp. NPDC056831]|uniref:hypothetical protein n=1 Tax=Streptomyces sp. NPDC056831 TaxID=3345954 RepID=UPI0036B61FA8